MPREEEVLDCVCGAKWVGYCVRVEWTDPRGKVIVLDGVRYID